MKKMKNMKKLTVILSAAVMTVCLMACGGKTADVTGTYSLYAIQQDDMCLKAEGMVDGSLILEAEGKGSMVFDTESADLTYEVDGEKISVTSEGGTVTGTIKDGVVNIEIDGTGVYFANENADTESIGALSLSDAISSMAG